MFPNGTLTASKINDLSNIYIVFLTPSVIGSFSVLAVSVIKWSRLREQVQVLVQLALADLLAALILMSTSIMNKVDTSSNEAICLYSLPLSLAFYFISFLLVVVYAWKSKNAIQGWRDRPADDEVGQRRCTRERADVPVYLFVWFFPLALYLAYVLTSFLKPAMLVPLYDRSSSYEDHAYCTSCILFLHVWRDSCCDDEKYHDIFIRVSLFIMVIPVMVICSIIYHKVGKWYEKYQQVGLFPVEGDGRSRRRCKNVISTARNMVMVILICWTPALVLIVLSTLVIWTNIEQESLFWLYVIQAISMSLQGFLNSVVYAWRRPNFTEAVLGEHTPLVEHDHQAFFEESLRGSL